MRNEHINEKDKMKVEYKFQEKDHKWVKFHFDNGKILLRSLQTYLSQRKAQVQYILCQSSIDSVQRYLYGYFRNP